MGEQDVRLVPSAGDQVDHALGQSRLVEQLQASHGREGHHAGGLEDEGVAGGDGQGDHPAEGDHGREVEGGDAREDPQGLPIGDGVVAGRDVHEAIGPASAWGRRRPSRTPR